MKNQVQKSKFYLASRSNRRHKCLNCGTSHGGRFCPNCGQSIEKINKPFKEFFHDMLDSLAAFDFRFWHSVKVMFTKPAVISEEYLEGKRVRFMPPLKLYFFVSFVLFFVMNWMSEANLSKENAGQLTGEKSIINFAVSEDLNDSTSATIEIPVDSIFNFLETEEQHMADSLKEKKQGKYAEKIKDLVSTRESKSLFIGKIYKNLSWMLILLMPVFALLLNLLYSRKNYFYVRHLVFAINAHSQAFIVLIVFFVLNHYFDDAQYEIHNYLLLLLPFYLLLSMRKFYLQGWSKTIVKFFILTTLYNFVLLAALVLVFVITFGTY